MELYHIYAIEGLWSVDSPEVAGELGKHGTLGSRIAELPITASWTKGCHNESFEEDWS